jgi:hypothetical protein
VLQKLIECFVTNVKLCHGLRVAGEANRQRRFSVNNDIKWGLIWLVGGGFITLATYEAAANGGSYFVLWGAMLYGGYRILKGLLGAIIK